jgi:hypothetical protein
MRTSKITLSKKAGEIAKNYIKDSLDGLDSKS